MILVSRLVESDSRLRSVGQRVCMGKVEIVIVDRKRK